MTSLLDITHLQVRFATHRGEVTAVDDASIDIHSGECLAIVGESGSGKSQLFLACLGLLAGNGRASGSARLQGQEMIGLPGPELRRIRGSKIAMIFQDPMSSLTPHLHIGEQLAEVLTIHRNVPRARALEQAHAALQRVHVPEAGRRLRQYPHELSGGLRQRVMIAMALLAEPLLLVADEPTTALDVTVQAQILDLLCELRELQSLAIALITHDLGVVAQLADRVAVMQRGRVVELADVEALFARPRHPYTQALLAAVPRIDQPLAAMA